MRTMHRLSNRLVGDHVVGAPMLVVAGGCLVGGLAGLVADRVARRLTFSPTTAPTWASMLAGAVLLPWTLSVAPDPLAVAASIGLLASLLTLSLVDIADFRLPDVVTLPLAAAGIVWALEAGAPIGPRLVGAAVGYLVIAALASAYRRLRRREGIGLGDAKLLAAAGAWLGSEPLPLVVLTSCALALALIGVRVVGRGAASLSRPLAFGPALGLGFWIVWSLRLAGRV